MSLLCSPPLLHLSLTSSSSPLVCLSPSPSLFPHPLPLVLPSLPYPFSSPRHSFSQELHSGGRNSFAVDHVCSLASTQEEVFQHGKLQALVDAVIDGFNSTVFAYGQTGSGKTFTMEGYEYSKAAGKGPHANFSTSSDRLGLTPRSVHSLFASVERHNSLPSEGSSRLRVMCHFVQIYKEAVLDLLNPSSTQTNAHNGVITGLKVRWSAEREFYVDNLFTEEVGSAEQALALFQKGVGNKRVAETRMNAASSRSHCIFTLAVQQMDPARPERVQVERRDGCRGLGRRWSRGWGEGAEGQE